MTRSYALELIAKHGYLKIRTNLWANPNGEDTMRLVKDGDGYKFVCQLTPAGARAARKERARMYTDQGI